MYVTKSCTIQPYMARNKKVHIFKKNVLFFRAVVHVI